MNYVGNKILENLIPKSKLGSKIHFVYNDKALKKRRMKEEEMRLKKQKMDALVKQAMESRMNESKKLRQKEYPRKQTSMAKTRGSPKNSSKTPAKKSFPTKIREQVNS